MAPTFRPFEALTSSGLAVFNDLDKHLLSLSFSLSIAHYSCHATFLLFYFVIVILTFLYFYLGDT